MKGHDREESAVLPEGERVDSFRPVGMVTGASPDLLRRRGWCRPNLTEQTEAVGIQHLNPCCKVMHREQLACLVFPDRHLYVDDLAAGHEPHRRHDEAVDGEGCLPRLKDLTDSLDGAS